MRNKAIFPFLILFFVIMGVLSISFEYVDALRTKVLRFIFPLAKHSSEVIGNSAGTKQATLHHQLELENCLLREQIEGVYEWLSFEEEIQEDIKKLREVSSNKYDDLYWNEFFRCRTEEKKQILELSLQSVPARVIFRDPVSWSSSIWVNVGSNVNESMGRLIVAKNSPVVIGNALVGIVEQVKEKFSRVRLISDSECVPSVRAMRGKLQKRALASNARQLLNQIKSLHEDLEMSVLDKEKLCASLELLQKDFHGNQEAILAIGEIHGSSEPLWRSKKARLKGCGFHQQENALQSNSAMIAKGDLLVTTGYDGVFPPGLHVGVVEKVFPLRKGGHSYEIEAIPSAKDFDDLQIVFIMPPLEFSKGE